MPTTCHHPIRLLSEHEFHNSLKERGIFLNTDLYKEAIYCLYNSGKNIIQSVEIKRGPSIFGKQNIPLLSTTERFCISSIRTGRAIYQPHLKRFLKQSPLKYLHRININNPHIEFISLSN